MYCSNCGARLKSDMTCPVCNGVSEDKLKDQRKKGTGAAACAKAFFSANPLTAVQKAALSNSAAVSVIYFALFFVLSMSFALVASMRNDLLSYAYIVPVDMSSAVPLLGGESIDSNLALFLSLFACFALLEVIAVVIAISSTTRLFLMAKEKPSLVQASNMLAVALLPMSLSFVLAIPLSFLSVEMSLMVIMVGLVMSVISYYFGLQKAASFSKSPFWFFFFLILAGGIFMQVLFWMFLEIFLGI